MPTVEEWNDSLDTDPLDTDLHRVYADWCEDHGFTDRATYHREVAESLDRLHALGFLGMLPKTRGTRAGTITLEDTQTGIRYTLNPKTGYLRRFIRVWNPLPGNRENYTWVGQPLNRRLRRTNKYVMVYDLINQLPILIRTICRDRSPRSKIRRHIKP